MLITADNWKDRMRDAMKLRGFRPKTQDSYSRVVEQFAKHVGRDPQKWTDEDVRRYILYLQNERRLSPSSVSLAVYGIRFFFTYTMEKKLKALDLIRIKVPKTLPTVLSRQDVRRLLTTVEHPVGRAALTTIYALGLRLSEALALEAKHIDGDRLAVWIREGKGGRDRVVALPRPQLLRLRDYWKHTRPRSTNRHLFVARRTGAVLHPTVLQRVFKAARLDAKIEKQASVHTLRHSYATHLLESGVSVRVIQQQLGHKNIRSTERYMHITSVVRDDLQSILDRVMANL